MKPDFSTASLKKQIESLENEVAQLKRELLTDSLTGLGNYKSFTEDLARMLQNFKKTQSLNSAQDPSFALLFIDVDAFKGINEKHGHWAASQLLGMVGRRIAKSIRENDLAYRYGGDEFVVLIQGRKSDVHRVEMRIKNAVLKKPFSVLGFQGATEVSLSVSIGVRILNEQDTLTRLIEEADKSLFEAKRKLKKQPLQWVA